MKANSFLNIIKKHRAIRILLIAVVGLLLLNLLLLAGGKVKLGKAIAEAGGASALNPYALKGVRPSNGENASLRFEAATAILGLEHEWNEAGMKKRDSIRAVYADCLANESLILSPSQERMMRDIIDESELVYRIMESTDQCAAAFYTRIGDSVNIDDLPHFFGRQIVFYLMGAKAIMAAHDDEPETAYLWVDRMFRCSGFLANETPTLISTLIGIGCAHIATETLEILMNASPPDRETRERLDKQLSTVKTQLSLRSGLEGERACGYYALENCLNRKGYVYESGLNDMPAPVFWLLKYPGRFLVLLNESLVISELNDGIEASDLPRYKRTERFGEGDRVYKFPVYGFLASIMIPNWDKSLERRDAFYARLDLMTLSLSLMDYKDQRGVYPEDLSALTPGFIDDMPVDPFTGKQYVYRPGGGGFVIYSVSVDGEDDGGTGSIDDWKDGDIVCRIR